MQKRRGSRGWGTNSLSQYRIPKCIYSIYDTQVNMLYILHQLLFLKETFEMIKLPSTCSTQHNQLQNCPPDNSGISTLTLIAKLLFPFLSSASIQRQLKVLSGTPVLDEYRVIEHSNPELVEQESRSVLYSLDQYHQSRQQQDPNAT